jgi:uncharacterized membrane protein
MGSGEVHRWIERSATGIEILAVGIISMVVILGTAVYVARVLSVRANGESYTNYRHLIGRALLLGLEILVAADVIRTVALEPTLPNIVILGLLVVIRTFLNWSLVLEIEGRWPWKASQKRSIGVAADG